MYWYLFALKNDESIDGSQMRVDSEKIIVTSGSAHYEGFNLTTIRADQGKPDFTAVQPGQLVRLELIPADVHPKPGQELWMNQECAIASVLYPAVAALDKEQTMSAKKIKVRYSVVKTQANENFSEGEKAAFLAEHPGCTVLHFGLPWFKNVKQVEVKDGVVMDRVARKELEGIVYYQ